jgi:hypothetical protein
MGKTCLLTLPEKAFEHASTNVAAAQMRNALTGLAETVKDPHEKKVRNSVPPYSRVAGTMA